MTCAHIAASKGSTGVVQELMLFNLGVVLTAKNKVNRTQTKIVIPITLRSYILNNPMYNFSVLRVHRKINANGMCYTVKKEIATPTVLF